MPWVPEDIPREVGEALARMRSEAPTEWENVRIWSVLYADGATDLLLASRQPAIGPKLDEDGNPTVTIRTIRHPLQQAYRADKILQIREVLLHHEEDEEEVVEEGMDEA